MARDEQDSGKPEKPVDRKERLAGALRENLKKRKRQARGRAARGAHVPEDPATD